MTKIRRPAPSAVTACATTKCDARLPFRQLRFGYCPRCYTAMTLLGKIGRPWGAARVGTQVRRAVVDTVPLLRAGRAIGTAGPASVEGVCHLCAIRILRGGWVAKIRRQWYCRDCWQLAGDRDRAPPA